MTQPTKRQIRRWRRYLADERAEAAVYRELARNRSGVEAEVLHKLADAESRHEQYWRDKLGEHVGMPLSPSLRTRMLAFMARHFGSVFTLALMQNAESRSPYFHDEDASDQIAADERLHAEIIRSLAASGRERMSGGFRAAVFGANDGLVSNIALILGVMGSGLSANAILISGFSGLFAGAFSMAAGEYISVKSQAELIEASTPDRRAAAEISQLDVNANELALVYEARGMSPEEAQELAAEKFQALAHGQVVNLGRNEAEPAEVDPHASRRAGIVAGASSFAFFAFGAFIPLVPFILGLSAPTATIVALVLVSCALLITGGVTGLLSGHAPAPRAFRQLFVGLSAAGVTYAVGLAFGTVLT